MKENKNLVIDKRRVKAEPEIEPSDEVMGTQGHSADEIVPYPHRAGEEHTTALDKPPGMSLAGQAALAEARPQPEFAVAPQVTVDEVAQIKQVIADLKIRCPRGWLLAKVLPPGEKIGSIILPEVCQNNADFAIVLEVGKGEFQYGVELPVDVKPGNHIMLPPFAGQEKKVLGADVLMLRQDEVQLIAGE